MNFAKARAKWKKSDRPAKRQVENTNKHLKKTRPFKD